MQCPQCGFQMNEGDTRCLRCQGQGVPGVPGGAPDDASSTGRTILGFFIPLVGGILYLKDRPTHPKRARSAGLGALIGCGLLGVSLPVIVIMAAILFPVFARARENALRASCQSNLKQLSLAAMRYTLDHQEKLPDVSTPESIRASLGRYVNDPSIYTCPSPQGKPYVGNAAVSNVSIAAVESAATTTMFMDHADIHLDGRNISFVDGHVKWYKAGEHEATAVR